MSASPPPTEPYRLDYFDARSFEQNRGELERTHESNVAWASGIVGRDLRDGHGQRALEIGCGLGFNAVALARSGYSVIATDSSPEAIERARQVAKEAGVKIDFRVHDAHVPLPALAFDVVICYEVLEHLHAPEQALANIAAAVAPRGVFLFTTPNGSGAWHLLADNDPTHINVRSARAWARVANQVFHGRHVRVESFQRVDFLLPTRVRPQAALALRAPFIGTRVRGCAWR